MPTDIPQIIPYGDAAFLIKYDCDGYDARIVNTVQNLAEVLRANGYWDEVVCGYDSVLVAYNPVDMTPRKARLRIGEKIGKLKRTRFRPGKTLEIPVVYGGQHGPDMATIQESNGLSQTEIVKRHSRKPYRVCMMGFMPGFTFLSEAPKALHHPRHTTPRLSVPAGSIGIAGWQTGIYGLSSPGGWQIIGRTSLKIFDKSREDPFLIKAGDQVKFVPVEQGDFDD